MSGPLVSCLMPTWNRREFVGAAIDCFLRQTYEPRELVIVDDGKPVEDLVSADPRIRYFRLAKKMVTGPKRNRCCELARGEILCHFDDDDWSADDRIEHEVRLLEESGRPIAGYGSLYFWDTVRLEAKLYKSATPGYVCGTSLCFLKAYWQEHPFPDRQIASDNAFIYPAAYRKLTACSQDASRMVARLHGRHTSSKGNIRQVVARELIPEGFWRNEEERLARCRG